MELSLPAYLSNNCLSLLSYLKGYPACRQQWFPQRPPYSIVTSFLQSLVATTTEPRYAMFGPGMEQLDVSMVTRLMHTPDVLPVAGIPQRQINGGLPTVLSDPSFYRVNLLETFCCRRKQNRHSYNKHPPYWSYLNCICLQ